MKTFLISFLVLSSFSIQASCPLVIRTQDVSVKWLAYKTPRKVAVQGEFKKFSFRAAKSDDVIGRFAGATFSIDSTSVATGNPGRDRKIVSNFFTDKGKAVKISGAFSVKDKTSVSALLKLQEASKEVRFNVENKGTSLILTADINVLDFSLQDNLSRINLACKALHEGVTWPDVRIMIEVSGKKSCK